MLGCYDDLLAACRVHYGKLSIPGQNVSCGACPLISSNLEVVLALTVLVLIAETITSHTCHVAPMEKRGCHCLFWHQQL
jgi:hypothetical protein